MAIENRIAESARTSLSLIDFSEVTVLDFSCADEVVAKLLLRYLREDRPGEAFFVLRGVRDLHRDPIEVALQRQSLAAVAEREDGGFELLGAADTGEARVWGWLEARGKVSCGEADRHFTGKAERETLDRLVQRRIAFRGAESDQYQALSTFVRELP